MQSSLINPLLDKVYMDFAYGMSTASKAVRKKVGAVLVTSQGVVLTGYNGTPKNTCNVCEDEVNSVLVTKPEVIHAELNCIMKAAREGISVIDSLVYVTLSPCVSCAAMLKQAGVKSLMYDEQYRDTSGIDYLRRYGMYVCKFER